MSIEPGPELGKLDLRWLHPTDVVRQLLTDQDADDSGGTPTPVPSTHHDDHGLAVPTDRPA